MINKRSQSVCKRCGRKLKNQKAIEIGMGNICWKKYINENNHKQLFRKKETEEIKNDK